MSSRCLLVVDADPAVHELMAAVSERQGRRVRDVYDGREALECLKSNACEVVLAGQGRNGFDAFQLLRRARSVRPNARVIVTGEVNPARAIDAIRERAFSYFHKPLAEGPLADIVQQAFDASAWKDDIRVLSARPDWITLDVRCKIEAAERVTHLVREAEADLPMAVRDDVAVAFRELLMNAVEHGGKQDPRKRVRASLVRTAHSLIVHIADPGTGFSLDFLPHAAISNPADSPIRHVEIRAEQGQRPGGFGILMTRHLVDELHYNERGNAVMFLKNLHNQPA